MANRETNPRRQMSEPSDARFWRLVNSHKDLYIRYAALKAKKTLDKEMRGEGCGCKSCMLIACKEMNSWTAFLNKGGRDLPHYRVVVNDKGKREIEEYFPDVEDFVDKYNEQWGEDE